MSEIRFFYPIQVRYSDLDPQGHVNNAKYLSYMEQARVAYLGDLGLWDASSYSAGIGCVLADVHLTFHAPIQLGQVVRVGVCFAHLGTKSIKVRHTLEDAQTGELFARAVAVVVVYDFHNNQSTPVPSIWREKIREFEGQLDD